MISAPEPRRRLGWTPFIFGMIATGLIGYVAWRVVGLTRGRWWHAPAAILCAAGTLSLAVSAIGALVNRPKHK